jgi:hypothetical protein
MTLKKQHDPINALLEERATLPAPMALFQRVMTTLPSPDEAPLNTGPVRLLIRDLVLLALFAALAAFLALTAMSGGVGLLAAPFSALASLGVAGRLRKLTVGHMHEASHGVGYAGWRNRGVSRRVIRALRFFGAEFCAIVAVTTPFVRYMRNHGRHHRLHLLGTVFEPDGAYLAQEGFVRGMAAGSFDRRLVLTLLNPAWYAAMAAERVTTSLTFGSPLRRVLATGWLAGLVGAALAMPLPMWLMAIGLPWLVLFPAASLLQVITEHPYGDRHGAQDFAGYAARTWDRIPWTLVPSGPASFSSGLRAWARWTLRTVLVHIPSRLAVLDTTMVWHRYHHIAWPLGRPFDAWWTVGHQMAAAWREGVLPDGWEANTLEGLPAALGRQKTHLETSEA